MFAVLTECLAFCNGMADPDQEIFRYTQTLKPKLRYLCPMKFTTRLIINVKDSADQFCEWTARARRYRSL
jgi:hypothetical protein